MHRHPHDPPPRAPWEQLLLAVMMVVVGLFLFGVAVMGVR